MIAKSAHYIDIQKSPSSKKLDDIYIRELVAFHGVLTSEVSDRDVRFTSRNGRDSMMIQVFYCTSAQLIIHMLMDKVSGLFRLLEDILRVCLLDFDGSWDSYPI